MIEIKLIPDGLGQAPFEARDHTILAGHLQEASDVLSDLSGPIDGWRDVTRVVPGHGNYIALRVPGEQADYSQTTLDEFRDAIIDNINGLKAHPDGWTEVEER